ncbi:molybdenum cofactor sulfurylase [Krasilnikovia cinnamomea]|uniref:Molybdenum cofactor sulfurylase n=1 Tax=Krasilnikovia cinnamomea TaxID=349313 RepID=A0A4Q7ZRW0_9ACTN|nr:xanthine dehydrogenase accessory protein XdhC [Krasilnikovia cinnamomea]RZU53898.1 molybdenum cofactor sulfurylase [Krasilnikovia cinnamomea]
MAEHTWISAVARLRETREPGVLVIVATVRGHAPRAAGAKLVVGAARTWGSVGGGNLEAVATEKARALLAAGAVTPEMVTVALSDKAPYQHGVQCCGGAVTLLLEPLPAPPVVAVFGVGHVGLELARILARHDLDLHLVDTRPEQLADERLAVLADAVAQVHVHRLAVLPEIVLGELPAGTHVLIMTHDHAEDLALCDAVLRGGDFGSIGLIGSAAKWARFRAELAAHGHDAAAVERITSPIGIDGIRGKEPATIAVSVAAGLLRTLDGEAGQRTAAPLAAPVDADG